MATKKAAAPSAQPEIDPAKTYRVTLARAVKHGPTWLRPNMTVKVSGETLTELGDAVACYDEAAG